MNRVSDAIYDTFFAVRVAPPAGKRRTRQTSSQVTRSG